MQLVHKIHPALAAPATSMQLRVTCNNNNNIHISTTPWGSNFRGCMDLNMVLHSPIPGPCVSARDISCKYHHPLSNVSQSFAFLDCRSFKALFHAGADLWMKLDVEGTVVSPRCVELCRVLIYKVSVFCTSRPTEVLHLYHTQHRHTHTCESILSEINTYQKITLIEHTGCNVWDISYSVSIVWSRSMS